MEYLKAKTPVQAIDGYLNPIKHKILYKETEQDDPITRLPNGQTSSLTLTIVQDWDDTIYMTIIVDGKWHVLSHELAELLQTLQDLTQQKPTKQQITHDNRL